MPPCCRAATSKLQSVACQACTTTSTVGFLSVKSIVVLFELARDTLISTNWAPVASLCHQHNGNNTPSGVAPV